MMCLDSDDEDGKGEKEDVFVLVSISFLRAHRNLTFFRQVSEKVCWCF